MSLSAQDEIYLSLENTELVKVNIADCTTEIIGRTGFQMYDIAINPVDQKMYGVSAELDLYEINVENASTRYIGQTDKFFNALAFSDEGILYGMTARDDIFYQISTGSGRVTELGSVIEDIRSAGDINIYKDKMYLFANPDLLVEINLDNFEESRVLGSLGISGIWGATSAGCDSRFYIGAGTDIYTLADD
ncbi:MAG: hypothetical protein AAFO69_20570, partial [Bacteroidota bacterium]